MKKLMLAVLSVALIAASGGGAVSANDSSTECVISGTGAESTNYCKFNEETYYSYKCEVEGLVANESDQAAYSGAVEAVGNTSVKNISTGDATNTQKVSTELDINCGEEVAQNGDEEQPPKEEQPKEEQPKENGQVNGEVDEKEEEEGAVLAADVAALPPTGENNALIAAAGLIGGLAAVAGISKLALAFYRRSE